MSLEEYDAYIESLEEKYNEDEQSLYKLKTPAGFPSGKVRAILKTLDVTWDTIRTLIHQESFTPENMITFLILYIRMIGASNGQVISETPSIGLIDIENEGSACYYLANKIDSILGCKLDTIDPRLADYVDFLKKTFIVFLKQIHAKNPELIPLLKTMDYIEILHKAIQFLFYFAGSKLKGELYYFGLDAFITELQSLLPDTIEISCQTNNNYGWGRYIFVKSCKNKRTQGKIFIGCTTGHEFNSINRKSYNIEMSPGPICDEPAIAAPVAKAGPAAMVVVPNARRRTRRRRNHRHSRRSRY
jgi:hypothetical protein